VTAVLVVFIVPTKVRPYSEPTKVPPSGKK